MRPGLFGDGRRLFSWLNQRTQRIRAMNTLLHPGRHLREVQYVGRRRLIPASEGVRSSMVQHSFNVTNPEGWHKVAGGRGAAETPGRSWIISTTPEGWQRSATPAGSMQNSQRFRGYRSAQPPATIWQTSGLLQKRAEDEPAA